MAVVGVGGAIAGMPGSLEVQQTLFILVLVNTIAAGMNAEAKRFRVLFLPCSSGLGLWEVSQFFSNFIGGLHCYFL
jgi:hypothetical protein